MTVLLSWITHCATADDGADKILDPHPTPPHHALPMSHVSWLMTSSYVKATHRLASFP